MKISASFLTLISSLTLFAVPGWAADRPCLQPERIDSWKDLPGNQALIVTDVSRKRFKLTLNGACMDLQWHRRLGFETLGRSRLTCLAKGDKILTRELEGLPGDICPIAKVEVYTPEMEKADADPGTEQR